MKDKLFYIASWIAIVLAGMIMFVGAWWSFYPYKTIEFEQPFTVLNENKEVRRGEELTYWRSYTKYNDLPGFPTREILCADGNRVTLHADPSNVPKGSGQIPTSITIPAKTSLGECVYRSTLSYQVNPIRVIIIRSVSEPFTVIE